MGTAAGPGAGGSERDPPIDAVAARQIADGYKVAVADVVLDARRVSTWNGPADDLLVWLEHRHAWSARGALGYLLSLRTALNGHPNRGSS